MEIEVNAVASSSSSSSSAAADHESEEVVSDDEEEEFSMIMTLFLVTFVWMRSMSSRVMMKPREN